MNDLLGIKFLTRLRLGLSHLNGHRFRHKFQDCLNSLCSCSKNGNNINNVKCNNVNNVTM